MLKEKLQVVSVVWRFKGSGTWRAVSDIVRRLVKCLSGVGSTNHHPGIRRVRDFQFCIGKKIIQISFLYNIVFDHGLFYPAKYSDPNDFMSKSYGTNGATMTRSAIHTNTRTYIFPIVLEYLLLFLCPCIVLLFAITFFTT